MPSELEIIPVTLKQAAAFIAERHRHHGPPRGWRFGVGVIDRDGVLRGVATAGRPVARVLDDGRSIEANRTCTDGFPNANSMLYGAIWRAAKNLGYLRAYTYTQEGESGASLRAAGWMPEEELAARGSWADSSVKAARDPVHDRLRGRGPDPVARRSASPVAGAGYRFESGRCVVLTLAQALAALPLAADGIASHLIALGCRGVRDDCCCCPVTNYLTGLGFDRVQVGARWIVARNSAAGRTEQAATPNHIRKFVYRFDAGDWPELVLNDAAEVADV